MDENDATHNRQWQKNKRELNRLHSMPGFGRELHGARIDELESDQDRLEYLVGVDHPTTWRRWSGLP
jgi:hypothetical protein